MHVCTCVRECPGKPGEGIGSLGAKVTDDCKFPDVDARVPVWLWYPRRTASAPNCWALSLQPQSCYHTTENAVETIAVTETDTARGYLPVLGLKGQRKVGNTKTCLRKRPPAAETWTSKDPGGWLSAEIEMYVLLDWAAAPGTGRTTADDTVRHREQTGSRQEVYFLLVALKFLLRASFGTAQKRSRWQRRLLCAESSPCLTAPVNSGLGVERTAC